MNHSLIAWAFAAGVALAIGGCSPNHDPDGSTAPVVVGKLGTRCGGGGDDFPPEEDESMRIHIQCAEPDPEPPPSDPAECDRQEAICVSRCARCLPARPGEPADPFCSASGRDQECVTVCSDEWQTHCPWP